MMADKLTKRRIRPTESNTMMVGRAYDPPSEFVSGTCSAINGSISLKTVLVIIAPSVGNTRITLGEADTETHYI